MIFDTLKNIKITLTKEKEDAFISFAENFRFYNEKINLMSKNDIDLLFEKHIFDSLAFNLFTEKYKVVSNSQILDIGTGGGFPSVPLAILYDSFKIDALDSTEKKIKFIKEIKEKLNLINLTPICKRAEDLDKPFKNSYDIVTSRAMAELRVILEYAIPFLKTDGFFVAYKSVKAEEELKNAQNALKILNTKLVDKIEYNLPLKEGRKRVLLIFKKEEKTPDIYPRKNGLINKKPL